MNLDPEVKERIEKGEDHTLRELLTYHVSGCTLFEYQVNVDEFFDDIEKFAMKMVANDNKMIRQQLTRVISARQESEQKVAILETQLEPFQILCTELEKLNNNELDGDSKLMGFMTAMDTFQKKSFELLAERKAGGN